MINDLKPYPEYKESGLPWLGQVPGHWDVRRLKHVFKRIIGGSTPASGTPRYWNGNVTWVTPADVSRSEHISRSLRRISLAGLQSCSIEMVPRHSIIMTSRAPVGNVALAEVDLCTNQGCKALIPNETIVEPKFALSLLAVMKGEIQSLASGTTFAEVSTSRLGSAVGILPPPDEQAAIVQFLDWANGRLDRAIRAKRKVIALLNEQKQAIIHRAVTSGLDPSVPLKDSGVPWLGEIPKHWEVRRLGSLLRERGEGNDHGESSHVLSLLRDRGVIPYDEKGNIGNKKSEDITRYKIVLPDDIVMNCMNVIIGSVGISRYAGCLSPVYYVLVRRDELDSPQYLNAIFQCSSFHRSLVRIGNGILAHRMRIPMELLKCELLPYPPFAEQKAIVDGLRSATNEFDRLIDRAEREITLLREYRTRLVADVVTGKLDVREAATLLPDQELLSDLVSTDEQDDDLPIEEEDDA